MSGWFRGVRGWRLLVLPLATVMLGMGMPVGANAAASVAGISARRPVVASYLFAIPAASGSLRGPNDKHLTLVLSGARSYMTRFTDRPLHSAVILSAKAFARGFSRYFGSSAPNAVLTYTPSGDIPVSIIVEISHPRFDSAKRTWTFAAVRIRRTSTIPGKNAPHRPNPRHFTHGTLMIDSSTPQGLLCVPGAGCLYPLAGADLAGADLSETTFAPSDFTGANLTNANLSYSDFTYSAFLEANLTGANLHGAILDGADLHGATLRDANLTGANLTGADLTRAYLTGVTWSNTTCPNGTVTNTGC